MNDRMQKTAILLIAICVSGAVCALIVSLWRGLEELNSVAAAVAVVLPVSLFILGFLFRYGSSAGAIVALTLLRVGLTTALAGFAAWKFPSLRTLTFFLSVTVVYLAGLYVETWLAWKDHQREGMQQPSS